MKKIIIFVCMFTFIFIGVRSVAISNEGEAYINSVYTDMLEQIKEDSDIEEMNVPSFRGTVCRTLLLTAWKDEAYLRGIYL